MITTTITLTCVNCGKDFKQEVKVKDDTKLEKEIEWYKKNQKHCPKCRMSRMGHGYGR